MKYLSILAVFCLMVSGCKSPYLAQHERDDWGSQVSADVMDAWHNHRSYYALVEILDTHINPWCNPATKAKVRKYLEEGDEGPDGYPGRVNKDNTQQSAEGNIQKPVYKK